MSRWGNFLSGIESGLDKILQEGETDKTSTTAPEKVGAKSDVTRAGSTRQKPDRLQARLTKAVEGRNSGESTRAQSRARTAEVTQSEEADKTNRSSTEKLRNGSERSSLDKVTTPQVAPAAKENEEAPPIPPIKLEEPKQPAEEGTEVAAIETTKHEEKNGEEAADTGDQFYLERIEALQAKLNFFIQEAADRARSAKEESKSDDVAKTAAQKDEKIAALMAEGQKLSEKELKHVGTIRRLHTRTNELESTLKNARKATTDAEREAKSLRAKIESAEATQKSAASDADAKAALVRQLDQSKKQNDTQTKELVNLRSEMEKLRANNDAKDLLDKQKQQLDSEKRKVADLQEELDNNKIERELSEGRQKTQLEEQRSKTVQERERASARESELESELKTLESRLESMRTRREEETGGGGDQQARQLRQFEALQRQYSVSKENWGSVEASLNSRIASLEKDRDELVKKETDLRRKLREATSSLRRRDDELEEVKASRQELQDKLQNRRQLEESTINELKASLKKAQADADEAREELKNAKASLAIQVEQAALMSKAEDNDAFASHERSHSPMTTRTKSPMAFHSDFKDRRQNSGLGLFPGNGAYPERPPSSRKVSIASPYGAPSVSYRQQSFQSLTRSSSRSAFRETNSIDDERETSDGMRTPATPGRGFNDVVSASASNPAAGPSVQLVERMSAAVRRLESEKAAIRDELDRMSLERDEARKQIVSLLEEVELKRSTDKKVAELEAQVTETSQRYQTTLELLGEKSEAVEELKADIADMKQIYRDALQKSMR